MSRLAPGSGARTQPPQEEYSIDVHTCQGKQQLRCCSGETASALLQQLSALGHDPKTNRLVHSSSGHPYSYTPVDLERPIQELAVGILRLEKIPGQGSSPSASQAQPSSSQRPAPQVSPSSLDLLKAVLASNNSGGNYCMGGSISESAKLRVGDEVVGEVSSQVERIVSGRRNICLDVAASGNAEMAQGHTIRSVRVYGGSDEQEMTREADG